MAHAHICLDCGMDLARTRAMYDTEYGLLVVQCPSCSRAAVRMRHPVTEWWRRFPGLICTLIVLLFQAGVLFLLTIAVIGTCAYTGEELRNRLWKFEPLIAIGIIYFLLPLLTGIWLAAFLSHKGVVRIWITWALWIVTLYIYVTFVYFMGEYTTEISWRGFEGSFYEFCTVWFFVGEGRYWINGAAYIPYHMIVLIAGMPIGFGIRSAINKLHSYWWRFRYNSRRRQYTQ